MKTKSPTLRQFLDQFPTEELCLDHIMRQRFGIQHECASCGRLAKFYRVKARRSYACEWCGYQVFPTAGTPFDRTRTPLRDWFFVMFMFTSIRNGVAAKKVERELGVTYKTAWRMCHEIRKYMTAVDGDDRVGGHFHDVEIDETMIGGYVRGRGKGYKGNKTYVVGMLERGGDIVTKVAERVNHDTMHGLVQEHVRRGSTVHTDEFKSYQGIWRYGLRHVTVEHSAGEYARPDGAGINSIEGFWAQLKRGINGTHIHVSSKHLWKYLGEFEYRWNMRHVPYLMLDRLMHSFPR